MTDHQHYAVSLINWWDHDLITEIVPGKDWKDALYQHSKMQGDKAWFTFEEADLFDLETAKTVAFDQDGMIEVVQI